MTSNNITTINIGAMTGAINPALNDNNESSRRSSFNWIATHSTMGISMETIARPISPSRKNPNDAK